MIERASVQPEPFGFVAPGSVDRPLQKPLSQPLADEISHQAELHHLNFVVFAPVEFRKTRRRTIDMQNMQFIPRVSNDGG